MFFLFVLFGGESVGKNNLRELNELNKYKKKETKTEMIDKKPTEMIFFVSFKKLKQKMATMLIQCMIGKWDFSLHIAPPKVSSTPNWNKLREKCEQQQQQQQQKKSD